MYSHVHEYRYHNGFSHIYTILYYVSPSLAGADTVTLLLHTVKPPIQPSGKIVYSGWLYKKGGSGITPRNWRKRWFILRDDCITYYYPSSEVHTYIHVPISTYIPNCTYTYLYQYIPTCTSTCTYMYILDNEVYMQAYHSSEIHPYDPCIQCTECTCDS